MPDVMAVILALSRIQSDLRMLQAQPARYPVNGHFEDVVNITTVLEGTVQHWMEGTPRATLERRTQPERRDHEPDRRHEQRRDPQPKREVA